jgi:hypothetical protein
MRGIVILKAVDKWWKFDRAEISLIVHRPAELVVNGLIVSAPGLVHGTNRVASSEIYSDLTQISPPCIHDVVAVSIWEASERVIGGGDSGQLETVWKHWHASPHTGKVVSE